MDKIVDIEIKGERVIGGGVVLGAAGSHDDVFLRITFDDRWDGLSKRAIWQNAYGENTVYSLLSADTGKTNVYSVAVPFEAKEFDGKMLFGVKGFAIGYKVTTSEPSDWATNYKNYYENTGTTEAPVYTAVTGDEAPSWEAETYYEKYETKAVMAARTEFAVLPSLLDTDAEAKQEPSATVAEQLQEQLDRKYTFPEGKIPKDDLSSAVQASLDLADSAIQSHQDISGKVDKITGKGLSTEDYTTEEKMKLENIEPDAEVNVLDGVQLNGTDLQITNKKVNITNIPKDALGSSVQASLDLADSAIQSHQDISGKVDKITGKGLSTEDYTTEEKMKLENIEPDAEVNVLDGVQLNGTDLQITNKKVNITNIPKDALGSSVRSSLDKADAALPSEDAFSLFCPQTETTDTVIYDAIEHNAINYKIYGNSVQDGTPAPDYPIEIESVGDLVTDTEDEHYGKYRISFSVNNERFDIYLNEPLRKVGDYADYIDFSDGKVHRFVLARTFNGASNENWIKRSNANNSFDFSLGGMIIQDGYCNKYTQITRGADIDTRDGVYLYITGVVIVTDLECSTVEEFKAKLQNSPMTIITRKYDQTEVSQESVSLPNISIAKGTTTIIFNTEISPSKTEIKYYQDINKVIANLQALILN